jgi:RNA polymerase sigma-70 factor (ECF subfamily)
MRWLVDRAGVTREGPQCAPSANEHDNARSCPPRRVLCDAAPGFESEDATLVWLAGANDDRALRLLYGKYSLLVYTLALRLLRNHDQAEEALQETFIRVWRAAAMYDPARGAVDTWIATITRNIALSMLRKQRSTPLREETEQLITEDDEQSDPEKIAWLHARRDMVRKALSELPRNQRAMIMLVYYQGMTHTEIAERTGVPLGTVKSRLRLGLGRLSALLEPVLNGAHDESACEARP